jgi:LPXTG-motif cell wall-anchored protein
MKKVMLTILTISLLMQVSAFEFCDEGIVGENDLRLISIDDMLKDNSKEWVWSTSEKVEIEARIENRNDDDATYILEAIFKDGDETIKVAEDSDDLKKDFSLSGNERKSVSLNFEIDEDADEDEYDLYIKFYKEGDEDEQCVENSEEQIEIEKIELCESGNVDENDLEIETIKDEMDDNQIEWEWQPGNEIEVSVNLKNKEYSQRTFIIELIMFDENNQEMIFTDNAIQDITLDEDEEDQTNLYFTLASEIEEGEYTLYAKAYDEDNEEICTSLKAESKSNPKKVSVERPERKVVIINVEGPKETKTFQEVNYTATITNFGNENEEKISLLIYNYKLGIKEIIEISDLDSGETENITFQFMMPDNVSLSKHALLFSAEYEYNERSNYYESMTSEKDEIRYYITLSEGTPEEEAIEEVITNETIIEQEITVQNETNETSSPIKTTITGNVIGTSSKSSNWPILIGLVILAGIGIYLFFKKPQKKKTSEPIIVRRHTAKL